MIHHYLVNCRYFNSHDVVRIFDGDTIFAPEIGVFSGNFTPKDILTSRSSVTVHFVSSKKSSKMPLPRLGFKIVISSSKYYINCIHI